MCDSVFEDINQGDAILQNRMSLLSEMLDSRYSGGSRTENECWDALQEMKGDTAKLVQAYQQRLRQLMNEQK